MSKRKEITWAIVRCIFSLFHLNGVCIEVEWTTMLS